MTSQEIRRSSSVYSQPHSSDSQKNAQPPKINSPLPTTAHVRESDDFSLRTRRRSLPKSPTRSATQKLLSKFGSQRLRKPQQLGNEKPNIQLKNNFNSPVQRNNTATVTSEQALLEHRSLQPRHKRALSSISRISSSLGRAFSIRAARKMEHEDSNRTMAEMKSALDDERPESSHGSSRVEALIRANGESAVTLVERGQSAHSSRACSNEDLLDGSTNKPRPFSYVPELIDYARPTYTERSSIPAKSPMRRYTDVPSSPFEPVVSDRNHNQQTSTSRVDGQSRVTRPPIGKWQCCECRRGQFIVEYDHKQHLAGILHCRCGHCPCARCLLTGDIKVYKPVEEPFLVQSADDDKHEAIRYGSFCEQCGLSWRAQSVKQSIRNKLSTAPRHFVARHRPQYPLEKVRKSRSMVDLLNHQTGRLHHSNSVASIKTMGNELERTHGQQVASTLVTLTGIRCTCTNLLNTHSLCFRILDTVPPPHVHHSSHGVSNSVTGSSFSATVEDKARGIETATLSLHKHGRTIHHPNPLMSNPIGLADLESVGARPVISSPRTVT